MRSPLTLGMFLAGAAVASLLWGRALWYFAERSQALRRWVFFLMGFTRRPLMEVRSLLLGVIYCGLGLLAALLFAVGFGLPVSGWIMPIKQSYLALTVLGAAGEISLANLLVDLICRIPGFGGPQRLAEMNDVPWIKGVRQLPPGVAPLAAALGGVSEEIFFRGVVQRILTDRFLAPALVAILIAGYSFTSSNWCSYKPASRPWSSDAAAWRFPRSEESWLFSPEALYRHFLATRRSCCSS